MIISFRKQFSYLPVVAQAIIIVVMFGIIAFIWAVTISPIEFVRFERDRQRVRDLRIFSSVLQEINTNHPQSSGGRGNLVYISLPDSNPDCSGWQLPELNNGYAYHCVSSANLRRIDGGGWLPVDFSSSRNWNLAKLPIDPKKGFYYQYIPGSFIVTAIIESSLMAAQLSEAAGLILSKDFEGVAQGEKPLTQQLLVDGATLAIGKVRNYINSLPPTDQQRIFNELKAILSFSDPEGRRSDKFIKNVWLSIAASPFSVSEPTIIPKPGSLVDKSPSRPNEVSRLISQILEESPVAPNLEDQLLKCSRFGGTLRIDSKGRPVCCPPVRNPL